LQTFVALQVVPEEDDGGAKAFVQGIAYAGHLGTLALPGNVVVNRVIVWRIGASETRPTEERCARFSTQ
jgi:hypothetical protein